MNGLDKIIEKISASAQSEADAILAQAQEKCAALTAEYSEKAQEEYWRLAREGAGEAQLQAEQLARVAVLESKKSVLAAKQEAVAQVIDEAENRICNLPLEEYIEFLARLAASAAVTGEEELIFNARDRAACAKQVIQAANDLLKRRKLPMGLSLCNEVGDFKGGLKLRQGNVDINCTVTMLVASNRDKLIPQVSEILFND